MKRKPRPEEQIDWFYWTLAGSTVTGPAVACRLKHRNRYRWMRWLPRMSVRR